ncbi:phage holin family protein [Enterococcus sp. AZ196]|uniref:phage holin family protein n=1 Tax=Enterococcus sp. AZ196 TaxID=2774659 RepID=UPI003D28F237
MDMKMILWAQTMMENEHGKLLIWLAFVLVLMAIDVVTGFIQAYINRDLKSKKMSNGLLKKFALLLVLVAIVPLTIVLPSLFSTSVIITVYALETLNEMMSIVENLNKLGIATNMFDPIIKRLQANGQEDEKISVDPDDQENNVR